MAKEETQSKSHCTGTVHTGGWRMTGEALACKVR